MRGSVTDFYTIAPTSRRPLAAVPPDYDARWIEFFTGKPLAPEIAECEACLWRAACRPGQYARSECAERVTEAPPELRQDRRCTAAGLREAILEHMHAGPLTIGQLVAACGVTHWAARRQIDNLLAAGRVVQVGARGATKLYGLKEDA